MTQKKETVQMRTNKVITAALIASSLVLPVNTNAQKKADDQLNTVVNIDRPYKPNITDAVKIEVTPEDENLTSKKPDISYTTPTSLFKMKPYKGVLKSPPAPKSKQEELYRCFAKLGYGNFNNIYGDFLYNSLRSKTSLMSAELKYDGGNGPVTNSGYNNMMANIYGKQIFGKNVLDGDIGYKNSTNHFYGYNHDSLKNVKAYSIKQQFSDFKFNANFGNLNAKEGQIRYDFGVNYYNFSDNYKTTENDIIIKGTVSQLVQSNNVVISALYDAMPLAFGSHDISRSIFRAAIGDQLDYTGFRAYLGFKTASETDTTFSKFHFYPDLEGEADLLEKYVTVFAGITGGLDKNTFKIFATENPYIQDGINIMNSNDQIKLYAGAKGSLNNYTAYNVSITWQSYQNYFYFVNDSTNHARFVPLYDNTNILTLHADMGYNFSETFYINGGINYRDYSMGKLPAPYQRPTLELILKAKYNINDKITVGGDIFDWGQRDGLTLLTRQEQKTEGVTSVTTTLPNIVDANLNVSYLFSNLQNANRAGNVYAFLQFNNILGNEYQYWNNYQVRGFQVLGGVMVNFLK